MSLNNGGLSPAIIIIHYQHLELTHRCLKALERHNHCPIYIVDNGSEPPVSTQLASQFKQEIHWIRSENNLGYGGGCNLGVKHAKAAGHNGFLILNNDTEVISDLAEAMHQLSQRYHHRAMIAPQIQTPTGEIWYSGGYYSLSKMRVGHHHHPKSLHLTRFINGCCLWIPGPIWDKLSGFEPDFFLYLEDLDLSLRAQKLGIPLLSTPDIKLRHYPSSSTGGRRHPRSIYYQNRNRWWFIKRHGQPVHWIGFLPFYLMGFVKRLLLYSNQPSRQRANLQALRDGLIGALPKPKQNNMNAKENDRCSPD